MFAYFQGTSGFAPVAVDKDLMNTLIELTFIEEYHWTPAYIRSLSYKWIQRHLLVKKARRAAQDYAAQLQDFKASNAPLKQGEKRWIDA